ncbi:hypothetical protein BH23CYA1_BH23CYA1_17110 [soil metagenome]
MQYLAKVYAKSSLGSTQLQLLAVNKAECTWEPITPPKLVATTREIPFNEQVLVLLELSNEESVAAVKDATEWVVDFVSEYLASGLTPKSMKEEVERAEQWRQSLTLQTQEVRRRALETAARRDEIQNLEKRLKLERETLETRD